MFSTLNLSSLEVVSAIDTSKNNPGNRIFKSGFHDKIRTRSKKGCLNCRKRKYVNVLQNRS